ncbi:hypothetical protein CB0940_08248 [Cercospora beticola]|uniref:Peptidase S26 domain-containing protein n=1 Tax=Cercospora beticola TaxID=122368 RepID=A0A2G5HRK5_CERBT|nr:hypothetical protein CB0940_08248 [Cercospora beticola]PIA94862.1 hypothetical protein CB0940_08248 [Cercospora beticola]
MIFSRLSSRGLSQPIARHWRNIASTSSRNTRAKPSNESKSPLVKTWDYLTKINWRNVNPLPSMMYATAFLLGYHVFTNYFYVIDNCHGQSMLPTFAYTGDLVCLSRYYRRGRGIQLGDLVSFKIPIKDEYGLKRVVGMPGDFVLMDTPGKSDAMIQVGAQRCPLPIVSGKLTYGRYRKGIAGWLATILRTLATPDIMDQFPWH